MTKLHFDDLTKITCPFGMLDDDTQERLMDCDETQYFMASWLDRKIPVLWCDNVTYRAKPKPQRLVTWVHWDEDDAVCCETHKEANQCLNNYGGYTYRIERDEDGSNPTIELVATGGDDE